MALRRQYSETQSTYADPILGVHLRESEENLREGEARLMANCEYYGGVRIRRGSQRINSEGTTNAIQGGGIHYFGGPTPQKARLVIFGDVFYTSADDGTFGGLYTATTPGRQTYFVTWSITDNCYISNGADPILFYNGTFINPVVGTNIPIARASVVPILDRLMAITTNGIERSNPRNETAWSQDSSWATFRPSRPGLFTALHPYNLRGTDTFYSGAIALQERAYYLITGTNYGDDVTALTAPLEEDGSIQLIDPTVGTASPRSVCTVPGIGMFWFTADLNVFWLPEGSLAGRYVGDRIQSTVATPGLESTYTGALEHVWMEYFDHMLCLGIPTGLNQYTTTQWWMDMRSLRDHPDRGPVWYGPMTGQSLACTWVENQQGDNRMMAGEGDINRGSFIYQIRVPSRFTDAQGITDTPITMTYQTNFKSMGSPSREKYVQAIQYDLNSFAGTATVDLLDLDGTLASGLPIDEVSAS